jgi:two-component system chemotaxis response regulator CheY
MRAIIVAVLKGLGFDNVREASNGADALAILKDWSVDVAIVDFRMEPVDGVAFTRQVRNAADSVNPYLPIIMLTGYADRARVFEARDAGVTELIVKPVTAQALIGRLNAVIHHPRPFIRSLDYFGPCRRRTANPNYKGPERRAASDAMRISA